MNNSISIIFPGQGSQELHMGRDIAESSKEAMTLWKKAENISGLPLRAVYWESGDSNLMSDTRYLQPALTVVNLSIWQQVSNVLSPQCMSGHSLGEFSALAAANVLTPEAVLELVTVRGKIMAEAAVNASGAMAAVIRLTQQDVASIVQKVNHELGDIVVIANYNTPEQFVISGTKKAIEATLPLVKERKGRVILLPVSGAFHSPYMEKAAQNFSTFLAKMIWSTPSCPIYANSIGKALQDKHSLYECIVHQMTSPVYWIDTIIQQWKDGVRSWFEVGPKSVLSRMIPSILENISIASDFTSKSINSLETITKIQAGITS